MARMSEGLQAARRPQLRRMRYLLSRDEQGDAPNSAQHRQLSRQPTQLPGLNIERDKTARSPKISCPTVLNDMLENTGMTGAYPTRRQDDNFVREVAFFLNYATGMADWEHYHDKEVVEPRLFPA